MGTNTKKDAKVTTPSAWKSKSSSGAPLQLPSGNVARIRRVSMQVLLKTGRIPNVLMAPVQKAMKKGGEQPDDMDFSKVMEDPTALTELFKLVDQVTVDAFVDPKVHAEPENEDDRDENLLYVDEIDIDDKMFVFQWMVGGTSDLESFRNEQAQQLESLSPSENLGSPA